ncbi:MAG: (4Fe-4S)-binding protein [Ferruginibacter sp.]
MWQPNKCIHSGICVRGLSAVFNTKRRLWIDMDLADTGLITGQVKQCPSGALSLMNEQAILPERKDA